MAKVNTNIIRFGGIQGKPHTVPSVGGKTIQFYGGERLTAIVIDGVRYGGNGGDLKATAQIPVDGVFTITKLQSRTDGGSMAYFEAKIGDTTIAVGNPVDDHGAALECNLAVRFSVIAFDSYVENIQFEIAS